jgi:hypothetical protein
MQNETASTAEEKSQTALAQLRAYLSEPELRRLRALLNGTRDKPSDSAVAASLHHRLLLSSDDLDAMGIKFHRVHRARLVKSGKFPAPIKLTGQRNFWVAEEIFSWIALRAAARGRQISMEAA